MHDGVKLLSTIFTSEDFVSFLSLETWDESGTRKSKIDRGGCQTIPVGIKRDDGWVPSTLMETVVSKLADRSVARRTNLFYGAAPRVGSDGFDEAWQIRRVSALWADCDNATPDDVIPKLDDCELPIPTAIVCSSDHGCHLYWCLDDPIAIDDTYPPARVKRLKKDNGRWGKYIALPDGGRLSLDARQNVPHLSARALMIQDTMSGIANAIDGDHVSDLARRLRVPGTLNHKCARNGVDPTRCYLYQFHPDRRYPWCEFERFAADAPSRRRREQLERVPLPTPRQVREGTGRHDKLKSWVYQCGEAEVGNRSEIDYAALAWCVEHRIDKDVAWSEFGAVGKFADKGRNYFDLTWLAAVTRAKVDLVAEFDKELIPTITPDSTLPPIVYDPRTSTTAKLCHEITESLAAAGDVYNWNGRAAVVSNGHIRAVSSVADAAATISARSDYQHIRRGKFANHTDHESCPRAVVSDWLYNPRNVDPLRLISLWTTNPVYSTSGELALPGYNHDTQIYYSGPAVAPRSGTTAIDELLGEVQWASPADRTNFLSAMLTVPLMPWFCERRPGFLFVGNKPGCGKTTLARLLATLRSDDTQNCGEIGWSGDEELEKRAGSLFQRGITTLLVDNLHAEGRRPIESTFLERILTGGRMLETRILGFSKNICVANDILIAITANTPALSQDIVSRCVRICLEMSGTNQQDGIFKKDAGEFLKYHRMDVIAELVGMVDTWIRAGKPHGKTRSRHGHQWAEIVSGILEIAGHDDLLANAADIARQTDPDLGEYQALVRTMIEHEMSGEYTASDLVELADLEGILQPALGRSTGRARATRMGMMLGRYVGTPIDDGSSGGIKMARRRISGKFTYHAHIDRK